jgi:hypothetical protein
LVFFLQVLLPKIVLVSSLLPSWPRTISFVSWLIYFLSFLVPGLLLFFHYGWGLILFSLQSVGNIFISAALILLRNFLPPKNCFSGPNKW